MLPYMLIDSYHSRLDRTRRTVREVVSIIVEVIPGTVETQDSFQVYELEETFEDELFGTNLSVIFGSTSLTPRGLRQHDQSMTLSVI